MCRPGTAQATTSVTTRDKDRRRLGGAIRKRKKLQNMQSTRANFVFNFFRFGMSGLQHGMDFGSPVRAAPWPGRPARSSVHGPATAASATEAAGAVAIPMLRRGGHVASQQHERRGQSTDVGGAHMQRRPVHNKLLRLFKLGD